MKNISYPMLLLSVLFLTGCGASRKAGRSSLPDASGDSGIPTVILYPKGYEPTDIERSAAADLFNDAYDDISFSGNDIEHVRVRGINPLPAAGILEVNLDELRGQFVYPYLGNFISDYGMRNGRPHTGVDIKAVPDDTIRCVLPGVVRMSKEYSSYGNIIVVRHYCGFETVYAHCSKNLVRVNDKVRAGTPIGLAGRTGRATTEHLHFEVRVAGEPIDPKLLLDMDNQTIKRGYLYARHHDGTLVAYNHPSEFERIKSGGSGTATVQVPDIPKTVTAPGLPEVVELKKEDTYEPEVRGSVSSAAPSPQGAAYHTVAKGDTLYGIARKYSTTVKKLCDLNGIKENGILSLGQKVRYR